MLYVISGICFSGSVTQRKLLYHKICTEYERSIEVEEVLGLCIKHSNIFQHKISHGNLFISKAILRLINYSCSMHQIKRKSFLYSIFSFDLVKALINRFYLVANLSKKKWKHQEERDSLFKFDICSVVSLRLNLP